ncbi:DUF2379 family protein [Stigmatella aurantiaca]|uniref:DUSAM domain-containing protein n=1 Tax=Stigmatella aurantiaca (strain DW4/3-1) TaxID=378806 RepID=E3FQS4_STIAD|nr:DUF2379 family protein [Stigmatella aurantiaca]ADO70767.1 uncharacterized protein STAUR_2975 [Stigmatella aurantiaca DW4/3-1]
MRARILDGSHRLSDVLRPMYCLRDSGELDAARHQRRDLLAVEAVPLYRDTAEGQRDPLNALS